MSSARRTTFGLLLAALTLSLGLPVISAASAPALDFVPASGAGAPRVGHYTPEAGALFNNPLGTQAQQRRLIRHMIRTIRSVPPRGTIRIAVFSFADQATSRALIAAYRRGVRVRLIFAGHKVYPPMERVRREIGSDISERSFVVLCERSCRGVAGQMHAKFFAFSRAGKARHITMVGSNNLTKFNAEQQWSDLYTETNNEDYFKAFKGWFGQLKRDIPVASTFIRKELPGHRVSITPVDLAQTTDPLLDAMESVRCEVTMGELDPESLTPEVVVPTRVLISTHAWNGTRGVSLARRVAELNQAGCAVQVFYGVGLGGAVSAILTNSAVTMSGGVTPGVNTHQKLLIVSGAIDGALATTRVVTGSHNWSTRALGRDDVIVEISEESVGLRYVSAFDRMWRKG